VQEKKEQKHQKAPCKAKVSGDFGVGWYFWVFLGVFGGAMALLGACVRHFMASPF
jgi:hypothetical protein